MSSSKSNNKPTKKTNEGRDPSLKNRKAGQSRTILLYPLHNAIEEAEIEQFVKRASLSSPLRIELFKFQSIIDEDDDIDIKNNDNTANYNAYAYCTFTSSADCWLIKKHLNAKYLKKHKVFITFSVIPRTDLEGITNIVEFGTNYPPITDKAQIVNFLKSYNQKESEISNPSHIQPAPGHGGIKGKWFITYDSPEMATKALEFYSGRYYFDTANNRNRFVIINYQLHRDKHPFDRKECFYGITDRVVLSHLPPNINDNDDILLFLQSNAFNAHKDVLDVYIIHQMTEMLERRYNHKKKQQNRVKFRPKDGYAIVTFSSYTLATKAYTNLNKKNITDQCQIHTGFASPSMTDPLKLLLKGDTTVVHMNNLPWDVTDQQIKDWCSQAAERYVEENKHLQKKKSVENKDKKEENPFYSTDLEAETYCSCPIRVYIKYRNGFSSGRANATFAKNIEADIVVEMMNGKKLGGRDISLNWALPIKDYKFKEQRNKALHLPQKVKRKKSFKKKAGKKPKKQTSVTKKIKSKMKTNVGEKRGETHKCKNVSDKNTKNTKNTIAKNTDNKIREENKNVDKVKEKRGKKRGQTFKKPYTKKIKLTL